MGPSVDTDHLGEGVVLVPLPRAEVITVSMEIHSNIRQ
jgi:hypothetical protein